MQKKKKTVFRVGLGVGLV